MDICRVKDTKKTKKQDETCCLGDSVVIDEVTDALSTGHSQPKSGTARQIHNIGENHV